MEPNSPNTVPVVCPRCGTLQECDPGRTQAFCMACGERYSPEEGSRAFRERFPGTEQSGIRGNDPPPPAGQCSQPQAYAPSAAVQYAQAPAKPKRKKRYTLLWVLGVLVLLGYIVPRMTDLRGRTERALPTDSPNVRTVSTPAPTPRASAAPRPSATPKPTPKPTVRPAATPAPTPEPSPAQTGVTPEFKAAMDKYEAFFDEYVAFMQACFEEPGNTALLLRYAEMLERYAEAMEALEAIGEQELSPADSAYYIQTMARIEAKLLKAAQYTG